MESAYIVLCFANKIQGAFGKTPQGVNSSSGRDVVYGDAIPGMQLIPLSRRSSLGS